MRCVRLYDSPETFFFFDPPYLNAKITAYKGWDESQMQQFAETLPTLQGKWIVTVDGSEFCQQLFSRWNCERIETVNRTVNNRLLPSAKFSELIVQC